MTHCGFEQGDFALFHPGGHLGRRIALMVRDLMHRDEIPRVAEDASLKEVILEMSGKLIRKVRVVLDGDGTNCRPGASKRS